MWIMSSIRWVMGCAGFHPRPQHQLIMEASIIRPLLTWTLQVYGTTLAAIYFGGRNQSKKNINIWKEMKASRATTALGFPGASKAADLASCWSTLSFSPVFGRRGRREGCIFMKISALRLKTCPPEEALTPCGPDYHFCSWTRTLILKNKRAFVCSGQK